MQDEEECPPFAVGVSLTILDCSTCGIVFAIPVSYAESRRLDQKKFSCPNSHFLTYHQERPYDELKREVNSLTAKVIDLQKEKLKLQFQLDQQGPTEKESTP